MDHWPVTISLPHGLRVSGVSTWGVQLASALARSGRRARLVVHDVGGDVGEDETLRVAPQPGLEVIRAPNMEEADAWRDCLGVYRDLLPAILLPFTLVENYAIAAALSLVSPDRLRVVGWLHSDNPYDYETLAYYESLIHRFVGVSRRCRDELARRTIGRAGDIERLPYGVDVPAAVSRPPLADRPVRLVYAGRMEQGAKRVFDLLALAESLDRRGVRFELRLVGDGPQATELRTRIAALAGRFVDPANRVGLDAPVRHERMAGVWSWADLALLVSGREGFSISMIESMACGCVPVVSRVESGVADIIEEGRNGLTFAVGDVEALADHIEALSADSASVSRLGAAARCTIEATCGYAGYFEKALRVMDGAATEPARPWPVARALRMNATGTGAPATAPSDAAERAVRLLQRIAQQGEGPVAIYGAGNHTRALASVWAESPVEIVGVIDDDDTRLGDRLWGWPIFRSDTIHKSRARSVVISSWMYEPEIWQRRRAALEAGGMRVYRLYAASPANAEV